MGKKPITQFSKTVNDIIGIDNPERYANHDWRSFFISKIANNAQALPKQQLDFSRHADLKAAIPYMSRHSDGEATFQRTMQAQGVKLPSARELARTPQESLVKGRLWDLEEDSEEVTMSAPGIDGSTSSICEEQDEEEEVSWSQSLLYFFCI